MVDAYKFSQLRKEFNLKNCFRYLGENENSAITITCAVALFKGIFRPLFTMMDKKSDPETKKYAAIREGLTELVALPIYAAFPLIVDKLVINKIFGKEPSASQKIIKGNAKFINVCISTALIPLICNYIQPPIMDAYKKRQEAKKAKTQLDIVSVANAETTTNLNKPVTPVSTLNKPIAPIANHGMKVGG